MAGPAVARIGAVLGVIDCPFSPPGAGLGVFDATAVEDLGLPKTIARRVWVSGPTKD